MLFLPFWCVFSQFENVPLLHTWYHLHMLLNMFPLCAMLSLCPLTFDPTLNKITTNTCGDLHLWWKLPQVFVVICTCGENHQKYMWWFALVVKSAIKITTRGKNHHMYFSQCTEHGVPLSTLLMNKWAGWGIEWWCVFLDIHESSNAALSAKFKCLKNSTPGAEFLRRCGKNTRKWLYYPHSTGDHTSDVEMRLNLQLRNTLPCFCTTFGSGTTTTV